MEEPQEPQGPEELKNLIESLEGAENMETRLNIEIEIIGCYIKMRKPQEEILTALEKLKISAMQEGLIDLAEKIDEKMRNL